MPLQVLLKVFMCAAGPFLIRISVKGKRDPHGASHEVVCIRRLINKRLCTWDLSVLIESW